jgi:hypothetical protein
MSEITAAIDEVGANSLFDAALATIGTLTKSGSGSLGPFTAGYTIHATFTNGNVDLIPPTTIRIVDLRLDWNLDLSFSFDLSSILPDFCLPQVCVDIPCVGEVCVPPVKICINWPTITIPVSFGDFLKTTVDLQPVITLSGGVWTVEAELIGVPNLQFGATSAALLAAIGAAATPILLAVPFIGPFLAIAVDAILAAIAIAGVTGFLGPIITPFVSGLKVTVYQQPQLFVMLPVEGPFDPQVDFKIDTINAQIVSDGTEDELVLGADISA